MNIFNLLRATFILLGFVAFWFDGRCEKLIILHTNDTHSAIDPLPDGSGGVLQRKAIIDSVRNVEKNVVTVDAGDMVQGTLYFKYFKGDVEYLLMNMTGYDIRVPGNHEFDNGMQQLAEKYSKVEGCPLSANYDFKGTELEGVFSPYLIKEYDGKKIGFFGINIDPSSIIAKDNISVNFLEIIPTANEIAKFLKSEKRCDLVVAVTHIGYEKSNAKTTDVELAEASEDIDIIIGGHSHTIIDPLHPEIFPSLIPNKNGKPVRVTQTGKQGRFIGKIVVDLDNLGSLDGNNFEYELIPVTDRFPEETLDQEMKAFLAPYKAKVDSVNNVVIATSLYDMSLARTGGMANMTADFSKYYADNIADSLRNINHDFPYVDMSIMNVGGIRHPIRKGDITEGQILSTYPFSNRFVLIEIKGSDLLEALRVAAKKGGEAVSGNVMVVTDSEGNLLSGLIDGKAIDPEREYVVGTIDYVAGGNDDLVTMANHRLLWKGNQEISIPILEWFKSQTEQGLPIAPDLSPRFVKKDSE